MAKMVEVKCANPSCGMLFTARVADRKRGWGKYHSKSCKAIHQERKTGAYADYIHRQHRRSEGGYVEDNFYTDCHPFSEEAIQG